MFLLDSDAAKKLCQYGLVHELAEALECELSDFAVLPQLKFQLKLNSPDKALHKLGTQLAVDHAQELVEAASEVEISMSSVDVLALNRPDIDTGEATLFAAVIERVDDSLISGDKRAYIALATINGSSAVDEMWARLICLEEAMLLIVQISDFSIISNKVRARHDADSAVSFAFGRSVASTRDNVIDSLTSLINGLQRDSLGKYQFP